MLGAAPAKVERRAPQFMVPASPWRPPVIVMPAPLAPLHMRGIRIINYIDDCLILAGSEEMAVQHQDVVLVHMKELGMRLDAQKSVLSPIQRTTFLGVVWDSTIMQALLSPARIDVIQAAVQTIKPGQLSTVKQFQKQLTLI